MPLILPDRLPAIELLKQENIFVMDATRASSQDIRPLRIAVLNLMPLKITTETDLVRLLSNSPLQIELNFMKVKSHTSKNTPVEHMQAFYTDFEEMLKDDRVECISICLPSAMHADFAVRAMEAGKHVLVEKPLDITPDRARLIEEARVRTGMRCGVVHQNRFNVDMYPIREAIQSGRLGRIILGTFGVKWYRDQAYYDNGGWRGTWEMDGGGSLMNQSVHTVDLMQWLMGEVASVTSHMGIYNHDIKTEDTTASLITRLTGDAHSLQMSLMMGMRLLVRSPVMLVSALAGRENVLSAYEEAVREKYRFFSFGDACFFTEFENL